MKIALVDDDASSVKKLEQLLVDNFGGSTEIRRFSCGEELLSDFIPGAFELIILDIYMGELTGVQTASLIRGKDKHVKLVFCSSSNEFASESYEVNACYYLKKPFTSDEFSAMLDRLEPDKMELNRILRLPGGREIRLRSVMYADYSAHYMTFHLNGGADTVVRMSFADAEDKLCRYDFFCTPSKGVIINFYEVASLGSDVFVMKDSSSVPISRRRYKEVTQAYAKFRFNLLRQGS